MADLECASSRVEKVAIRCRSTCLCRVFSPLTSAATGRHSDGRLRDGVAAVIFVFDGGGEEMVFELQERMRQVFGDLIFKI